MEGGIVGAGCASENDGACAAGLTLAWDCGDRTGGARRAGGVWT